MTTLTPADVGEDLRVETETALRLIRAGVIPAFKVGRYWRIDPDEFADWKATRAARPADPNRVAPRSSRSTAALSRRRTA